MSAATEVRRSIIENEDVARIYHQGLAGREDLSETDPTRFRNLTHKHEFETNFVQEIDSLLREQDAVSSPGPSE